MNDASWPRTSGGWARTEDKAEACAAESGANSWSNLQLRERGLRDTATISMRIRGRAPSRLNRSAGAPHMKRPVSTRRESGKPAFTAYRPPQSSMACPLPPEMLDLIIDHLHDERAALNACCVTAKWWIPRARKHLFARLKFAGRYHFTLWMKTFPDPFDSPARYTRSLFIQALPVITVGVRGCICTFTSVEHLHLESLGWGNRAASLVPFHGLSPTVRSLHLTATCVDIFDLVCSFPLLEDLKLDYLRDKPDAAEGSLPLTSPRFTGSLDMRGIRSVIHQLLDLPNGLHFMKITIVCLSYDLESTNDLVLRCSGTLEYLDVRYYLLGVFISDSVIDRCLTTLGEYRHICAREVP